MTHCCLAPFCLTLLFLTMNDLHHVFVYGTLQRGCSNHVLLSGSAFLGAAVTRAPFVLRTLVGEDGRRGIPFVGADLPIGPVHGEVFLVDDRTLVELDRMEGYVPGDPDASWYRRETVNVSMGERLIEAFMYFHERPASPLVSTGRWRDAKRLVDACFYFAYGSNMNPERMQERGVPFDQCLPATLPGHALAFNKRGQGGAEAYAHAMQEQGQDLPGLLYRVSDRGMQALDRYEGVHGGHYHRVAMNVDLGKVHGLPSKRTKAWVYFAGEAHIEEGLPVSKRYLAHIRRGHAILGLSGDPRQRRA